MESNNISLSNIPPDQQRKIISYNRVNSCIKEFNSKYRKRLIPLQQNSKVLAKEFLKQADKESYQELACSKKSPEKEGNLLNKIGEINLISQYHEKRFESIRKNKIEILARTPEKINIEIPIHEKIRSHLIDRKKSNFEIDLVSDYKNNAYLDILSTKSPSSTKLALRTPSILNDLFAKSHLSKENFFVSKNEDLVVPVLREKALNIPEKTMPTKSKVNQGNQGNEGKFFTVGCKGDIQNDENLFQADFMKLKSYVGALQGIVEKAKRPLIVENPKPRINTSPVKTRKRHGGRERDSFSSDKSFHESRDDMENNKVDQLNKKGRPDLLRRYNSEAINTRTLNSMQTNQTYRNDNLFTSPQIKKNEHRKAKFFIPKILLSEATRDYNDAPNSSPAKIGRAPREGKDNEFIIKAQQVMNTSSNHFNLTPCSKKKTRKISLAEYMGIKPKKIEISSAEKKFNSASKIKEYSESQVKVQQMMSNFYNEAKEQKTLDIEDGTNYILRR